MAGAAPKPTRTSGYANVPALLAACISLVFCALATLSEPYTTMSLLTLTPPTSTSPAVRFGVFGFCTPDGCTRIWPYRSPLLNGTQRYLMLLPMAAVAEGALILSLIMRRGPRRSIARLGAMFGAGAVWALYALREGAKWPREGVSGGAGDLCGVAGGMGSVTAWLLLR